MIQGEKEQLEFIQHAKLFSETRDVQPQGRRVDAALGSHILMGVARNDQSNDLFLEVGETQGVGAWLNGGRSFSTNRNLLPRLNRGARISAKSNAT